LVTSVPVPIAIPMSAFFTVEFLEKAQAADTACEQRGLHRVAVLAKERVPAGLGPACGELVRAEPLGPGGRLSRAQAALPVCPFAAQDPVGAERVPRKLAERRRPSRSRCIRQSRSHVGSPYYFRRLRPVATSPPTLGPGASAVLVPVMIRTPVLSYAAAPAAQRLAWLARKWWPHSSSSTGCVRLAVGGITTVTTGLAGQQQARAATSSGAARSCSVMSCLKAAAAR
jgi:hypothetical protein